MYRVRQGRRIEQNQKIILNNFRLKGVFSCERIALVLKYSN